MFDIQKPSHNEQFGYDVNVLQGILVSSVLGMDDPDICTVFNS